MSPEDSQVVTILHGLITETRKEIAAGFATVNESLVSKADKADLARLEGRLDGHAERIGRLESQRQVDEAEELATIRTQEKTEECRAKNVERRTRWLDLALGLGVLIAIALGVVLPFVIH